MICRCKVRERTRFFSFPNPRRKFARDQSLSTLMKLVTAICRRRLSGVTAYAHTDFADSISCAIDCLQATSTFFTNSRKYSGLSFTGTGFHLLPDSHCRITEQYPASAYVGISDGVFRLRSEERRVGKECRSRW